MTSTTSMAVSRLADAGQSTGEDMLAVEEPLEIRLSHPRLASRGQSISVTMRTPGNDVDLALGFLFGESIIDSGADVRQVERCGTDDNVVTVFLREESDPPLERLRRHFYTTSSCGVCGKQSIDAVRMVTEVSLSEDATGFAHDVLIGLPAKLLEQQPVFAATGGNHAAALFRPDGAIVVVAEDVGRHNAVDKVVGHLVRGGRVPARGLGLLVSGRASFELVQKAVRAGIPLLAAVGAPSSLAVEMAREFDLTLVGFLRQTRFNIYSAAERLYEAKD